jgi:hypothetical protein
LVAKDDDVAAAGNPIHVNHLDACRLAARAVSQFYEELQRCWTRGIQEYPTTRFPELVRSILNHPETNRAWWGDLFPEGRTRPSPPTPSRPSTPPKQGVRTLQRDRREQGWSRCNGSSMIGCWPQGKPGCRCSSRMGSSARRRLRRCRRFSDNAGCRSRALSKHKLWLPFVPCRARVGRSLHLPPQHPVEERNTPATRTRS